MKKDFRYIANIKAIRSTGTAIFVVISLLLWSWMTYFAVRDETLRMTHLLSTAGILYMVWTVFQMLFRKRNYLLVWFACFFTLYLWTADWIAAMALGHFSHPWLERSFEQIDPWLLQVLWMILLGCVAFLIFPFSKKLYHLNQKNKESGAFKGSGPVVVTSGGGVLVSKLLRKAELPFAVTVLLECLFALCIFFVLGWLCWMCLLNALEYHHDEIEYVDDSDEKMELL